MAVAKHFWGLDLLLATRGSEVGRALTVVGTAVPWEAETEKAKPRTMAMAVNCMMENGVGNVRCFCWISLGNEY